MSCAGGVTSVGTTTTGLRALRQQASELVRQTEAGATVAISSVSLTELHFGVLVAVRMQAGLKGCVALPSSNAPSTHCRSTRLSPANMGDRDRDRARRHVVGPKRRRPGRAHRTRSHTRAVDLNRQSSQYLNGCPGESLTANAGLRGRSGWHLPRRRVDLRRCLGWMAQQS
jgi:hypothetical protein